MKRLDSKALRPCELQPVEKKAATPLPDVPEHFNYGIFYDDGYDYMQYLKTANFNDKALYRITGIPEDEVLKTNEPTLDEDASREPVVDNEPIPEGLGLDSDAENEALSEASEIEDNFVEMAGGQVVSEATDVLNQHDKTKAHRPISKDKVLLMERFLYGDNKSDMEEGTESEDDEFENPDDDTVLNRQFEKLLLRCKSRSGSANQSAITGTSMMSEGLQYALSRDTRMLRHQHHRTDEVVEFGDELKCKTVARSSELAGEEPSTEEDSDKDDSDSEPDIMSINSDGSILKPRLQYLTMPVNPKRSQPSSRQVSMECLTEPTPANLSTLDPNLLVRKKDESGQEKRLRKLAVKQHRQERRKLRKLNQTNFRLERERDIRQTDRTLVLS